MDIPEGLIRAFELVVANPFSIAAFGILCLALIYLYSVRAQRAVDSALREPPGAEDTEANAGTRSERAALKPSRSWNFAIAALAIIFLTLIGAWLAVTRERLQGQVEELETRLEALKPKHAGFADRTDVAVMRCSDRVSRRQLVRLANTLNDSGHWGFVQYGELSSDLRDLNFGPGVTVVTDLNHPERNEQRAWQTDLSQLGHSRVSEVANPGALTPWYITFVLCASHR